MTNAERQKAYRERKKKAKQEAVKTSPLDLQAPVDPAPESAMQVQEPLTVFDVLQRRMEREAKR